MTIKIVTDSTCDLPQYLIEENGISMVPCYINFGTDSYLDEVDITRDEFYKRLPQNNCPATTAAPGVEMFTKVYGDLVRSGAEEIISIHLSSNLSNIYNVACLAAEELNGVKISVVDGGQLTMGTGMLVLEAVKAASEGKHAAEITSMLREMTKKIFTFAVIDTFEYLKRSGRVSHLVGGIGEILQVKPILKMNNGNVSLEKIRTRKNAIRRLIKLITDLGPLSSLSVVHTNYLKGAEELIGELKKTFPNISPAFISQVTPIIGVHIGPGAVGFVAVQE